MEFLTPNTVLHNFSTSNSNTYSLQHFLRKLTQPELWPPSSRCWQKPTHEIDKAVHTAEANLLSNGSLKKDL